MASDSDSKKTNIAKELAHINREMYKKNFELAERNKTLALLRKIDEIVLSSVTETREIAQQVANTLITEAEFKAVGIFVLDNEKGKLTKLAISETALLSQTETELNKKFGDLPLTETLNIVVKSVQEKKSQVTYDLFYALNSNLSRKEVDKIQNEIGIKSSLAYPLIVRNEILGSMLICLGEDEHTLSQYQKDLINRLVGVVGIAIDNALLYKKIQDANEKLKELDKLKDEFVSLASHELRTPMTVIKSYLWMLLSGRGGELTGKQKQYAQIAYNSTDRLIKLVNDMLNVSRIESGRLALNLQVVDIEKLVEDAVSEVLPKARELGIELKAEIAKKLPPVLADPDKIKEVLINLIGNSLKFTPKGGRIEIGVGQNGEMIEIAVADTGRGIAKDDLSKLFTKFGLIDGTYEASKQDSQGTGLGLYICKNIVELHGGRIWAESEGLGRGAKFTFSLKVAKSQDLEKVQSKQIEKPQVGIIHSSV